MASKHGGGIAKPTIAEVLAQFLVDQRERLAPRTLVQCFTLARVKCDKGWLEGMLDGRELGPINIPEEISRRCKVGWTICGVVGRVGERWRIVEAWNVYSG